MKLLNTRRFGRQLKHSIFHLNGEPITRRQILETFLYGDNAHVNHTEHERFNRWRQLPDFFGNLLFEFVTILNFIVGQIMEVAEAAKHELSLKV
jgi:hypothetical protein